MGIVAFHFLLDLEVLIGQRLAHLLCFQSQNALKCILLRAQDLHFTLVEVELLGKLADHVLYTCHGDELDEMIG